MQSVLQKLPSDILNLFFSKSCLGCGSFFEKSYLCVQCTYELAYTNFLSVQENKIIDLFSGRCRLSQADALLYFEKETIEQKLIHQLKYQNKEYLSIFFGDLLGRQLKYKLNDKPDIVIPVPIHPKRKQLRGYNQVSKCAQKVAFHLDLCYDENVLKKSKNTNSQSKNIKWERWSPLDNQAFKVIEFDKLEGKHILLIDDIITTGNTLESCINSMISNLKNVRISIASICLTR